MVYPMIKKRSHQQIISSKWPKKNLICCQRGHIWCAADVITSCWCDQYLKWSSMRVPPHTSLVMASQDRAWLRIRRTVTVESMVLVTTFIRECSMMKWSKSHKKVSRMGTLSNLTLKTVTRTYLSITPKGETRGESWTPWWTRSLRMPLTWGNMHVSAPWSTPIWESVWLRDSKRPVPLASNNCPGSQKSPKLMNLYKRWPYKIIHPSKMVVWTLCEMVTKKQMILAISLTKMSCLRK